jgi:hypothetical protein
MGKRKKVVKWRDRCVAPPCPPPFAYPPPPPPSPLPTSPLSFSAILPLAIKRRRGSDEARPGTTARTRQVHVEGLGRGHARSAQFSFPCTHNCSSFHSPSRLTFLYSVPPPTLVSRHPPQVAQEDSVGIDGAMLISTLEMRVEEKRVKHGRSNAQAPTHTTA